MLEKIKNFFKNTGKKERTGKLFAGFLVFMLACTITSRGIYAWQMPQVTAAKPENRAITQKIEVTGTVEAQSEQAVVTEPGIRVKKINVQTGELVESGTVLLELDQEDLLDQLETLKQELTAEQERLSELNANQSQQKQQEQTAKNRAAEDYTTVTQNQDGKVAAAQAEYDRASLVCQSYPTVEVYLEDAKRKSTEYQSMKSAAEKSGATEEEKQAFSAYAQAFDISERQNWSEGKASLEADLAAKESALNDAKAARDTAVKEASRAVEDAGNTVSEESSITAQEAVVTQKTAQVEKYQALYDENGAVTAETAGTIGSINVTVGNDTPEGAVLTVTDTSEGYLFSADITEEQKKYINVGDSVTLKFKSGAVTVDNVPVSILAKNQENTYHLAAKFSSDEVVLGESGTINVTTNPEKSGCCVPLSALYASGTTNYVLILREKQTILGTEYYVEQKAVIVDEKNEQYASLKDNPVSDDEEVVVWSDRAVSPGDTVRMKENEE